MGNKLQYWGLVLDLLGGLALSVWAGGGTLPDIIDNFTGITFQVV
mgnify:CR=1 FL=1